MSKTLCIYHGNCADGFGAAWVVRKAFAELGDHKDHTVDFFPGVYQKPPPATLGYDEVLFVDFSYKRAVIQKMLEDDQGVSITVLDHHASAMQDLESLVHPRFIQHFDMSHSGAMIAWLYFFGGQEPPQLLKHIEDRDLWLKKLEGTEEIQANLFSHPYDFLTWDVLMQSDVSLLRADGQAIQRKHMKDIYEMIGVGLRRASIGGYDVPALNVPYLFSSEAGHILAEGEPFAACYMDTKDGRVFSLRSRKDGVDVSEVAKLFGGGGHKQAAGFLIKHSDSPETVVPLRTAVIS